MSQVIRISDELYERLGKYVLGFETPANVIEKSLNAYELLSSKIQTEDNFSQAEKLKFFSDNFRETKNISNLIINTKDNKMLNKLKSCNINIDLLLKDIEEMPDNVEKGLKNIYSNWEEVTDQSSAGKFFYKLVENSIISNLSATKDSNNSAKYKKI